MQDVEIVYVKCRRMLRVAEHAWAWSARTTGFPVLVVDKQGNVIAEYRTRKREMYYPLPDGAEAVLRFYISNSGRPSVEFYKIVATTGLEISVLERWSEAEPLLIQCGFGPETAVYGIVAEFFGVLKKDLTTGG